MWSVLLIPMVAALADGIVRLVQKENWSELSDTLNGGACPPRCRVPCRATAWLPTPRGPPPHPLPRGPRANRLKGGRRYGWRRTIAATLRAVETGA